MDIRYHNYGANIILWNFNIVVFVEKLEEQLWTSDITTQSHCTSMNYKLRNTNKKGLG